MLFPSILVWESADMFFTRATVVGFASFVNFVSASKNCIITQFLSFENCFTDQLATCTTTTANGENHFSVWHLKAMSRIARLLSHHSFGAKNALERHKNPLNQTCKSWPSSSFSFPPKFDIKLSSSWQVRVRNYRPNNMEPKRKQQIVWYLFHLVSLWFRIPNPKSKSTLSLVTAQIVS